MRKVKDAKEITTGEKIYFKSHAKATYMSDGRTVEEAVNNKSSNIVFTNISASEWVSDSTYPNFGFKCDISCPGVTSDMFAEVTFSVGQATGGNYAPVCETKTDIITIWSSTPDSIIIPTIIVTI